MAAQIGSINVALLLNSQGYVAGMTRAEATTAAMTNRIRGHVGAVEARSTRSFSNMAASVAVLHGPLGGVASRFSALGSLVNRTSGAFAAGAVAVSALGFASFQFIKVADRAKLMSNQLKTVTTDTGNLVDIQNRLFNISQRTRSSMEASVQLYSRTARASKELGTSQEDLLRVTETVQKAFAIGGATTAEAQGGAIQLSQGIASDRFSGDEYRSVSENAPVLLAGMARSMGVTIGKLREMAHAGQLTSGVVIKAILESSSAIDSAFAKTEVTVGQAFTRLGNALLMYVGETNETYGWTNKLAASVSALADNFNGLANAALFVGGAIASITGARLGAWAARGAAGGFGIKETVANSVKEHNRLIAAKAQAEASLSKMKDNLGRPMAELDNKRFDKVNQSLGIQRNIHADMNSIIKQREVLESSIARVRAGGVASLQNAVGISDRVKKIAGDVADRETFITNAKIRQAQIQQQLNTGRFVGIRGLERQKKLVAESNKLAADTVRAQNAADAGRVRLMAAMTSEHAKLTGSMVAAQRNLAESSAAVARARAQFGRGTPEFRAAQIAHVGNIREFRATRTAIAGMNSEIASLGRTMTVTGAIATRFRASIGNLHSLLGGWWGIGIMAAIGGWMLWQNHVAKAQKQTDDFKARLRELGYVVENVGRQVGDGIDLADLTLDIEKVRTETNKIRQDIGNVAAPTAIPGLSTKVGAPDAPFDHPAVRQVRALIRELDGSRESVDRFNAALARIMTENRGNLEIAEMVFRLRELNPELAGAIRLLKDLEAAERRATFDFSMFPGFESMQQILGQYTKWRSSLDASQQSLEKLNKEHRENIKLLEMGKDAREIEVARRKHLESFEKGNIKGTGTFETNEEAALRMAKEEIAAKKLGEAYDEAADKKKKFNEGMDKLRLEAMADGLGDLGRSFVSTAQSIGFTTEEIEKFIKALHSGDYSGVNKNLMMIAQTLRTVREAALAADIAFDRSQLFRSDWDRDIASKLRSVYGDKEYLKHMDGAIAAQMRLNQQIELGIDLSTDFAKGLVNDLREGVKWTEALSNAFMRLGNRFIDMAIENAVRSAWGALTNQGSGGILGSMAGGIAGRGSTPANPLFVQPVGAGLAMSGVMGQANPWSGLTQPAQGAKSVKDAFSSPAPLVSAPQNLGVLTPRSLADSAQRGLLPGFGGGAPSSWSTAPISVPNAFGSQLPRMDILDQMFRNVSSNLQGSFDSVSNVIGGAGSTLSNAISISAADAKNIGKVVMTEIDHSLARINPQAYQDQAKGVVDTILNRVKSDRFPDSVDGVLNQHRQFSKITGPANLNPYGSVANAPPASPQVQGMVDSWLQQRAMGAPSSVGGHLNYANPAFSTPNNMGWISQLQGPSFGVGNMSHLHGTAPGFSPVGDFGVNFEGFNTALAQATEGITAFGIKIPEVSTQFGDSLSWATGNARDFAFTGLQPATSAVTQFADNAVTKAAAEMAGTAVSTTTMGTSATMTAAQVQQLGMASQTAAGQVGMGGFGGGGLLGSILPLAFSGGGLFRGLGGPRDDKNLARISDGEYIVNAASTAKHLPLLEAINQDRLNGIRAFADGGMFPPVARLNHGKLTGESGFADSGSLAQEIKAAIADLKVNVNLRNINTFDAGSMLRAALASREGEEVLNNYIRNNAGAIRQQIGA